MASSIQAALHMDPSNEKSLELFKNSEFENINGLFGITRMMIEGNSEKKRMYFPQTLREHKGKTCVAKRTSNHVRDQVYNTCCCEFLVWSAFLSLVWHMHDVCLLHGHVAHSSHYG